MSDWDTQEKCWDDIQSGYDNANWTNTSTLVYLYNDAYDAWRDNNDHLAISKIVSYLYWDMYLHSELLKEHDTEMGKYALPYYLQEYTIGKLTMDMILDAMWDSDRLRNFHFINWIDAMRAGIWNTQIYERHLVDWYKHFSE